MQRVDPGLLNPNESLMIIREGEGEDFDFIGKNYVVWDRLVKISGDEPVALLKDGQIIDKIGDDECQALDGMSVKALQKIILLLENLQWFPAMLTGNPLHNQSGMFLIEIHLRIFLIIIAHLVIIKLLFMFRALQ